MVTECEIRAYAKGAAYFSIGVFIWFGLKLYSFNYPFYSGFCFPYILLSAFLKKSNPKAFRYLLIVPFITSFHTLTYIPKDLEKCRVKQQINPTVQ